MTSQRGVAIPLPKKAGSPVALGHHNGLLATNNDVVLSKGGYMDIIRIIFAILLPPVGVFLQVGLGLQFWINIVLTLLGYIPGIIHAIWIIATR